MANKNIAYEKITGQIVDALEKGIVPWKKPWTVTGGLAPINLKSKKVYNGINLLILGCAPHASHVWGTFKQWTEVGGTVRKGEKSTPICFWTFFDKRDANGDNEFDAKGRPVKIPFLRYYSVFNAEQIDGIELDKYMPEKVEGIEFNPIAEAERVIAEMPNAPQIIHGGNVASYAPSMDIVRMPNKDQFHSEAEYYSTNFHELSHSTGHKSRVGRDLKPTEFGSESYSKEELIAEISACFLCSSVGIEQTFDNSAAYIKGWLKKLKDDKKLIVRAASAAKRSAEYILGNAESETETEKIKETETA
jgi:antirestriction protein ArdC